MVLYRILPLKMAATSQQFDVGAVGSEDYLSALTRRLEALEKRVVGQGGLRLDQPPLKPTLEVSYQDII